MSGVFVTGTDTEIGKTWASVALIHALRSQGLKVNAMKPVAAGIDHPSDAELLAQACGHSIPDRWLNPLTLSTPVSPHLAARIDGQVISLPPLLEAYQQLAADADRVVVEGAGGWMVPLSDELMLPDLAKALALPVVLVVGLKLGCLNHALLSAARIQADGCRLAGWIGNQIDPGMGMREQNIETLQQHIDAPLLGVLPRLEQPSDGAEHLNVRLLSL